MNLKQKIALVAIPAVLALGGGALAVQASSGHPTAVAPAAVQTATDPTEPAGAAEAAEAPEAPGAPEVGHADAAGAAGAEVDNQFDGEQ
jgi:hypothetical protein